MSMKIGRVTQVNNPAQSVISCRNICSAKWNKLRICACRTIAKSKREYIRKNLRFTSTAHQGLGTVHAIPDAPDCVIAATGAGFRAFGTVQQRIPTHTDLTG